jgi:site-specific recombinase XerD
MSIADAIETYITERSAQVSPRMVEYWHNQCKPLSNSKTFGEVKLSKISSAMIGAYQSERLAQGRAPKTINGEISVLRQLLKHARIWYRF